MCGIWGFVGAGKSVDAADAWTGLCSLTDRGPDDWGVYTEPEGKITDKNRLPSGERGVFLGNRRLSILDLSAAGNQPMDADGRYWIVYNGEVYNYRELRAELHEAGYEFTSDADTEVVLRAYQEYGPTCVERFRGMFAFTVYDAEEETLFAARDRFGIKPFYYDVDDGGFAFASAVTSLLDSGVSEPRLDPVGLDGYLTFGFVPTPHTILDGVRALPPGARLTYDATTGHHEVETYWTPSFERADRGDDDVPSRVRELLREAVELRLRSDVPVGAFLSGGLDSSAVVALLREAGEAERLHTFSIDFGHEEYSETDFAELVADEFETTHTSRTVTAGDVDAQLDDIVASMDQPSTDGVNTYFVSEVAADAGLKVVLSGLGSDELFFGYPTFERVPALYRKLRWVGLLPDWVRGPAAGAVERFAPILPVASTDELASSIRSGRPFGSAYTFARGVFTDRERARLVTGDAAPTDWEGAVEDDTGGLVTADVSNAVSQAELNWYLRNQLLRDTDAMSMTHSLEARVPFLDARFAEYVMAVDSDRKAVGEKGLLKDALRDTLPLDVVEREKSGFIFPFADWLREDLAATVDDALAPSRLADCGLDGAACESVRTEFERGEGHWTRLWALVVLSLWVQKHVLPHRESD